MRTPYLVALGTVGLLLLAALLTWQERMFLLDPAFVSFEIVNRGWFVISEHRYAAAVTQAFPLVTSWLGLPLQIVLMSYAASFYLLYGAVTWVVGLRWRQYELGILLAGYLTLLVGDVFYWPNNEVHQGIAWMILFLAGYQHWIAGKRAGTRVQKYQHPLLVGFLLLATNAHMIVAMPLLFLWVFLRIRDWPATRESRSPVVIYTLLILATGILRYVMSKTSWYDGVKLARVGGAKLSHLGDTFRSEQLADFLGLLNQDFWPFYPVLGLGLLGAVLARAYWAALLTAAGCVAYAMVVSLVYPEGFDRSLRFYYESEWQALSLIVLAPFTWYYLPRLRSARVAAGVLVLLFSIRLGYIAGSYDYFHRRFENLSAITEQLHAEGPRRALLPPEAGAQLLMPWGTAAESFLLSSVRGYRPNVTFLVGDHPKLETLGRDSVSAPFGQHPLEWLNDRYFEVDTSAGYERTEVGVPLRPLE